MTSRIFIDTLFVIALVNRRDQFHLKALELADQYEGHPLIVTDAVLLEIGNGLARNRKQAAIEIIEGFLTAGETKVVPLTPQLFAQGFTLYKSHHDKSWGLVDCISFIVMQENGIQQALTCDQHFVQAGFQALMMESTEA